MPWLAFRNNYHLPISVAVMQVDHDACGGESMAAGQPTAGGF